MAEKHEPLTVLPAPSPEEKSEPLEEEAATEKPKEKTASIVEKIIENLEETYRQERAKEIQTLYNDFVDAITTHKAHVSNILTALELVKQDVIMQKIQQIRGEATS